MIYYVFRRNRYRCYRKNILEINPKLVIIDSIQTMYSEDITSAAGTVSQVREITSRIMRICKKQ